MRILSEVELVITGYDSPEGPAFDRDGNLFFVNWESSSIVRLTPDGVAEEWFNTGGIPAGLAFDPAGNLWVADEGAELHGLLRITPDREVAIVANDYHGTPLNGANDLVFARDGTLYFSDPWGSNADRPIGGFYRRFADGRLERIDTELAFPNGVALAPDESAVYLAETYRNRILRYAINPDGTLGPAERWATTTLPSGPDGMAFDANGDLYVAHYGGGSVDIFNPNGQQVDTILVPGTGVTNVAFGGENNRTLYITEVETRSLYRVRLAVSGLPLNDGRTYG